MPLIGNDEFAEYGVPATLGGLNLVFPKTSPTAEEEKSFSRKELGQVTL